MTAQVASTSSASSRGGGSTEEGTFEGSNSLTSSVQVREETSVFDMSASNSLTSSVEMRGENSTCSSRVELSLPSSFESKSDRGGSRQSREMVESLRSGQTRHDGGGGTMAIEVYDRQASKGTTATGTTATLDDDDANTNNTEDQLSLRISKETKPMMHLLRLLKEMDNDGDSNDEQDPKGKARASLISDFEKELTLIEHRIKDENLIMNGEQPPLPANWIALEDPDSGDIYYANEATGETKWERPGLVKELKGRSDNMKNSNMSNNYESGMQNSTMSNNYESSIQDKSNLSNNYESSVRHNSNRKNKYESSVEKRSNRSNNYEGSMQNNSNTSNSYEGSNDYEGNMRNSNTSNIYEGGMMNSNTSNNHDGGMENSNMSNNFDGSQRGSNSVINTSKKGQNFEDSQSSSSMSNTHQTSLTDSHNGERLPPNWIALEDPDSGETYYANEVTGESTWDKSTMPQSTEEEKSVGTSTNDDLLPDWIALEDADSGDPYYLNQVTMATTWDKPSKGNDNGNIDMAGKDQNSQQQSEDDDVVENTANKDDLPSGWEAILEPSSGDYYYAHESGETQWERPEFSKSDVAVADTISQQSPPENDDDELPADKNLLPGWFAAVDEDSGDQYYCNEVSGETTWDVPTAPAIENDSVSNPNQAPVYDEEDDGLPEGWFAVPDPDSGDPYYVHEESGETTWDRPTSAGTDTNEHLMSRPSIHDNSVYEDDSIQF